MTIYKENDAKKLCVVFFLIHIINPEPYFLFRIHIPDMKSFVTGKILTAHSVFPSACYFCSAFNVA